MFKHLNSRHIPFTDYAEILRMDLAIWPAALCDRHLRCSQNARSAKSSEAVLLDVSQGGKYSVGPETGTQTGCHLPAESPKEFSLE